MSGAAIEIRGAVKIYHGRPALSEVSLELRPGETTALLGASGSGKSTLLRLIAGLEPMDRGLIRLDGKLVSRPGLTVRPEQRKIGFVFQDYALFPHLTALENVAFGLEALSREARQEEARRWLGEVGLAARAQAYPHALSGGEQQRVALARALAPRPRAVLLDEPFSGLDPALRSELRDVALSAIRTAGATAAFVTHDADEALYVADRLAILKDGRLVQSAPPREAYERPSSLAAAAALGIVNTAAAKVRGGAAWTPFGPVPAGEFPEGAEVLVAVRAEALELFPGAGAEVLERRPQGASDLVKIGAGGLVWRALTPAHGARPVGPRADVRLAPWGAFVFNRVAPDPDQPRLTSDGAA